MNIECNLSDVIVMSKLTCIIADHWCSITFTTSLLPSLTLLLILLNFTLLVVLKAAFAYDYLVTPLGHLLFFTSLFHISTLSIAH